MTFCYIQADILKACRKRKSAVIQGIDADSVFQEGISGMIIAYIVAAVIVVGFVGLRIYQYCFRFSKDARDYKRYRGFDHTTGKPRFDD